MAGIRKSDIETIKRLARDWRLDPAALLAVVHVESGGRTGSMVDGQFEPIIRFEGHYFDRRLKASLRVSARRDGLSDPQAGGVKNPTTQKARYDLLARAAKIDRRAAYESCSWGVGQVMGAHWKTLGYQSVDELVACARSGLLGQVELMLKFIAHNGLEKYIRSRNWSAFALRYNGPAYRKNRYDQKMARAYLRYAKLCKQADKQQGPTLRHGMRGDDVASLQTRLTAAGFAVSIDGHFGEKTAQAVRRFQRANKLAIDGICGSATRSALDNAVQPRSKQTAFVGRLVRILAWLSRRIAKSFDRKLGR